MEKKKTSAQHEKGPNKQRNIQQNEAKQTE